MEIDEKDLRGYLKDEYLLLQNLYEDFDRRSLTIKGWIATGAVTALAISFTNEKTQWVRYVPLIMVLIAVTFWFLEATWKQFQYAFRDRIRSIEAYFRGDADILEKDIKPFQAYHSWSTSLLEDEPIYLYETKAAAAERRQKRKKGEKIRQRAAIRPTPRALRFAVIALEPFVCLPYVLIIAVSITSFVVLSRPAPPKAQPTRQTVAHAQDAGLPAQVASLRP